MALLGTCWLIIEVFVIPNGFLKLFYLKFYIHPIFLVFFQIFLWLKELQRWILLCFCFLFSLNSYISSFIFRFVKRLAVFLLSFIRPTKDEVFYDVMDHEIPDDQIPTQDYETVVSCSTSNMKTCTKYLQIDEGRFQLNVLELKSVGKVCSRLNFYEAKEETDQYSCKDSWLNEYLDSAHCSDSIPFTYDLHTISERSLSSRDSDVLSSFTEFLEHDINTSPVSTFIDQDLSCMINNSDVDLLQTFPQSLDGLICSNSLHEQEDSEISSRVIRDLTLSEEMLTISEGDRASHFPIVEASAPLFPSTDDYCTISAADWFVDDEYSPTFHASNLPAVALDQQLVISRVVHEDTDTDSFHQMYIARMRFFDVLYEERLFGMNEISKEHLACSKLETEKIMKSLESDFELVYVAQTCLSWEALHHQYRKIEALASLSDMSNDHRLFRRNVLEKFQKFQILLERFMEDEKSSEGKKNSNYIQRRCQLHVPDVTGSMEEENSSMRGEAIIRASEVLIVIHKCIEVFWTYVKSDNKTSSSWKFKAILWSHPPVEDPRDLELLYSLSKELHKKRQHLNDLQGKKKGWLRRRVKRPLSESVTKDVLFAMIDLKLSEKVLKMSIISTSHLNWCQQKLNSLEFRQGKLFRNPISCLFPCSS